MQRQATLMALSLDTLKLEILKILSQTDFTLSNHIHISNLHQSMIFPHFILSKT